MLECFDRTGLRLASIRAREKRTPVEQSIVLECLAQSANAIGANMRTELGTLEELFSYVFELL